MTPDNDQRPPKGDALKQPELIIGIAGPIGVDVETITQVLKEQLDTVGYKSDLIRLTEEMKRYHVDDEDAKTELSRYCGSDTFNDYMYKMSYANAIRKQYNDPAVLARIAIESIRQMRKSFTKSEKTANHAFGYIIRQLKRPEEVALLRQVYGPQFVLASAYAPQDERRQRLCDRLRMELSTLSSESEIGHNADLLIERDASEEDNDRGQALRETFHLGDVFIDGIDYKRITNMLQRFVQALFGKTDISPSKDEYGMYAAHSASLRSSDLSRQVGAAVLSGDGEIITQGCNEVPKAFGGYYWDLEEPDNRDVKRGFDPNDAQKREVLRDIIERLRRNSYLGESLLGIGSDADVVKHLIAKGEFPNEDGPLVSSKVMDLTEFGRVVHAEMASICDAARVGRSVKNATLYCTTFPCHNCTKHILASGIRRVVYMEPYPKSRAKDLHPDEIEIEHESISKVSFVPFMGISPYKYKLIFEKKKRKDDQGKAFLWYKNKKQPLIDVVIPSYILNEGWSLKSLLGTTTPDSDIGLPQ